MYYFFIIITTVILASTGFYGIATDRFWVPKSYRPFFYAASYYLFFVAGFEIGGFTIANYEKMPIRLFLLGLVLLSVIAHGFFLYKYDWFFLYDFSRKSKVVVYVSAAISIFTIGFAVSYLSNFSYGAQVAQTVMALLFTAPVAILPGKQFYDARPKPQLIFFIPEKKIWPEHDFLQNLSDMTFHLIPYENAPKDLWVIIDAGACLKKKVAYNFSYLLQDFNNHNKDMAIAYDLQYQWALYVPRPGNRLFPLDPEKSYLENGIHKHSKIYAVRRKRP